jgi:hypothetical protein
VDGVEARDDWLTATHNRRNAPPLGPNACLDGDPTGHAVKPAPQRVSNPDRSGPADEHQKRGLEGVFDIIGTGEDAATDAQDHRPVAGDQGRKGGLSRMGGVARLGPVGRESLEQLGVGKAHGRPCIEERTDPPQEVV